jgi:hypothetical protein
MSKLINNKKDLNIGVRRIKGLHPQCRAERSHWRKYAVLYDGCVGQCAHVNQQRWAGSQRAAGV